MLGVTCIHGISAGGDEARAGYEKPIRDGMRAFGSKLFGDDFEPDVAAVSWASLARDLAIPFRLPGFFETIQDYLEDVVTYLQNPEPFKSHVREQIIAAGRGRILCAHSMGSRIALDVILDALDRGEMDASKPREEQLCAGLVTIGSPLGISLRHSLRELSDVLPRVVLEGFLDAEHRARSTPAPQREFVWVNFADPDDIVVTGRSLWSVPDLSTMPGYRRLRCRQRPNINTGNALGSHTGYMEHPSVHQELIELTCGA